MKNRFFTTAFRHGRPLTTLALLLAAVAAGAQTPASFAPVRTYSAGAGSRPRGIAVGDVNGDGRPDLVTANDGNGTAGVLLGQAGGGFAAVSTYSTGANSYPISIAVADVNGDSRPDLVTANNNNTGTVGVLLGQASGGFAAVNAYSTGGVYPFSIAVGDVNGDGRLDLITANIGDNTTGVLLGQAGGGFAPGSTYFTGPNSGPNGSNSSPGGVTLADLNGDGRLDLITANYYGNTAGVLLGQAGGGFAAVSTYSTGAFSYPQGIAVGDVNGDGRPDLVTANGGNGTAGVLLGQAGGGFAAASTYSTSASLGPQGIAIADVNGDGRPDLVTANDGSNTVSVLLNTGTYTPLTAAPTTPANDVVLFPNPAHGGFAVQLPAAWGASSARAELRNALGQEMTLQVWSGRGAFIFATEGLAPGVYVLRVQAAGKTLLRRVVLN